MRTKGASTWAATAAAPGHSQPRVSAGCCSRPLSRAAALVTPAHAQEYCFALGRSKASATGAHLLPSPHLQSGFPQTRGLQAQRWTGLDADPCSATGLLYDLGPVTPPLGVSDSLSTCRERPPQLLCPGAERGGDAPWWKVSRGSQKPVQGTLTSSRGPAWLTHTGVAVQPGPAQAGRKPSPAAAPVSAAHGQAPCQAAPPGVWVRRKAREGGSTRHPPESFPAGRGDEATPQEKVKTTTWPDSWNRFVCWHCLPDPAPESPRARRPHPRTVWLPLARNTSPHLRVPSRSSPPGPPWPTTQAGSGTPCGLPQTPGRPGQPWALLDRGHLPPGGGP